MFDLLKEVEPFDVITIFRHKSADPDAMGSQFGTKLFLEEFYPNKKVFAIGNDIGSCEKQFPIVDEVSDEIILSSCAIILDTANAERIDDQRFSAAKKIVKIDHHIIVDEYADIAYVDTSAAATCEIVTHMIKQSKFKVSKECAKYLYLGLLADSISFTTSSTTEKTLLAGAFLVSCGIDVNQIQQQRSGVSVEDFNYVTDVRKKVKRLGGVAYAVMYVEEYKKYNLSYNQAKEKVYAMSNVNEFEIFCLFTEDTSYEGQYFNGSLRSKNVAINEIANKFRGGGHAKACGVKQLNLMDIDSIVKDLNDLL